MTQIIGINNGNLALFKINETECKSKRGRNVGNKIEYTYVCDIVDINDYKDISIDSSIINSLNVKDYDLTLPKVDPSIFKFGKYKGNKIVDCKDYEYLIWYYPNITDISIRERVLGVLSNDYIFKDNRFYKKNIEYSENTLKLISLLSEGKDVLIKFDKNISSDGEYINPEGLIVKFKDYKSMRFNGMSYGLAGAGDNHYSRLKNKTIHIDKYEFCYNENMNRYILTIGAFELMAK